MERVVLNQRPPFSIQPHSTKRVGEQQVHCFSGNEAARDPRTIRSFGEEWKKFSAFSDHDIRIAGDEYFDIVPKELFGPDVLALDVGCGSGRWSRYLSQRVGQIEAIDPSEAIFHAAAANSDLSNVGWSQAGVDNIPFSDGTFDLVICLGVLHHIPDTAQALEKVVKKIKPGGHLLLYLYYALDGRGPVYRSLFRLSELLRKGISILPGPIKRGICDVIAWTIYLPLRSVVRLAKKIDRKERWWRHVPLSYYHNKSMHILRNDALDRFGTPLDKRFNEHQIRSMMEAAGLIGIQFSDQAPYWHAIAQRTNSFVQ